MSENPLNKFEKHALVIRLLKEEKTYREICHIAHIAPRDIKRIAKEYERKKRLESKNRKQKNLTKKPSISTQSFILYKEGKQIDDVKVLLDIPFKLASRYWKQYLKSIGMFQSYEFYRDYQYDIPTLLSINNFMKKNDVYGNDVLNIVRQIQDVISLNKMISNLKEELKQTKNNYSLNQNTMGNHYLPPLGPLPNYFNW